MPEQYTSVEDGRVLSHDSWIIETLLIQAHRITHNHSRGMVRNLGEPEDAYINYPPRPPVDEADLKELLKGLTQQEAETLLYGRLTEAEESLLRSLRVKADPIKQEALRRIFADRLRYLMVCWLSLFDGTAHPRLVEATDDLFGGWPGARIRALSPEELKEQFPPDESEDFWKPRTNGFELRNKFMGAYPEFHRLISAEPYVLLKVKNFEDDETVIKTLMLEAYCEIEIQSREFIKELPDLNMLVYQDEYETWDLLDTEKQALRSMNLQDEAVGAVLQKLFAHHCHGVVSLWLETFDWEYSKDRALVALTEQPNAIWQGAKISAERCAYGLVETFDDMRQVFYELNKKILSQPPPRPF
jgi:hypothetical protein